MAARVSPVVHALPPTTTVVAPAQRPEAVLKARPPDMSRTVAPTHADVAPVTNRPASAVNLPPDKPALQPEIVQSFVMGRALAVSYRIKMGGIASYPSQAPAPVSGRSLNFMF